VTPEYFSNEALRAVPLHRAAQPFRGGDAEPSDRQRVRQQEQRREAALDPDAALVHELKLDAAADVFVRSEARHDRRRQIAGPEARAGRYSLLTVRRLRPFARRRLSTSRPFFVLMRTRNPCVFLR
jgi:hypothetical protein